MNFVCAPNSAVRENNPFNPVIGSVVYRLLHMWIFQIHTNSFGLYQESNVTVYTNREINECTSYRKFRSDMQVFIIT